MLPRDAPPLPNVVFCCVRDTAEQSCDQDHPASGSHPSARYTRSLLKRTLQMMGCKPRHADKACDKLFLILQQRAGLALAEPLSLASSLRELRPGMVTVTLLRSQFEALVSQCLAAHDPGAPLSDFRIACALQERQASVVVLLCGTSGTGKSTLASLLAARLGITTVVSTDSIRQMVCSFAAPDEQALLRLSTYQAGAAVQQQQQQQQQGAANGAPFGAGDPLTLRKQSAAAPFGGGGSACSPGGGSSASSSRDTWRGYMAQCEAVMAHVDRLVAAAEAARRSVVLEGVHLTPVLAVRLMARCPSLIPLLIHISNEAKHLERFAVRAKTMTLRPERNRYVRHLRSIRAIQAELCAAADRCSVPRVDNTNVDRSVATIHVTVLGCMRRRAAGEALLDPGSGRCGAVLEEYQRCTSATWSGRSALELIKRKAAAGETGSSTDGPSTSAASTPQGPLSEAGEVAAAGQGSFYGSDSQSSQGGEGEEGGAGLAGNDGGAAQQQDSALGSVLETEGQSENAGG